MEKEVTQIIREEEQIRVMVSRIIVLQDTQTVEVKIKTIMEEQRSQMSI
jgi:hypothetical protein